MPLYDFECVTCGDVFEEIVGLDGGAPPCPSCGDRRCRKLIAAPAIQVKTDKATSRIEKRVKGYLKDGKVSDAVRFADKAASMVKSDKVKRISDKLHQKTGK
jgi:putative FmdB family regulatory protein